MTKAIIISGGTPPSFELLKQEICNLKSDYIIIAADSGANCLYDYKITPNYLLGDFDSINPVVLNYFTAKQVNIINYPTDKEATDNQLAYQKALELNVTEIVFLGCLGGKRVDHVLGALGMLLKCATDKITATIKDEFNTIFLLEHAATIKGLAKQQFSLQAYCDVVKKLSISGSKFNLDNYDLKLGDNLTIANEFINNEVKIDFASGKLLVILQESN